MRRREFISVLGSALALWPVRVRAQMPTVGFVNSSSAQVQGHAVAAYRGGLEESGFIEGKNVLIESRFADGEYNRLPELVADLIERKVAVIMAGGPPAAIAAQKATSIIPIVFTSGDDPVQTGLVTSINRPGGNVTGVYIFFSDVETKKLGLLRQLVPNAALITALVNPTFPTALNQTQELHKAADKLGQRIQIINASSEPEIDAAFGSIKQLQAGAILVTADPFFASRREQIVSLAAKYAIPAVYEQRAFTAAGGLMSYGTNLPEGYRQAGILHCTNPQRREAG
jgi:putative tryptophan/tyrosine transport system substrate-binding protein